MNVYYRGMATVTDQPGKWRNTYGKSRWSRHIDEKNRIVYKFAGGMADFIRFGFRFQITPETAFSLHRSFWSWAGGLRIARRT